MGYYCYVSKKGNRSLFFAHKACMVDRRSVEALLLKGNILLDMKKLQDAMNHFREAVVLAPHRYETHKVHIFLYPSVIREIIEDLEPDNQLILYFHISIIDKISATNLK